ncbi:MAG: AraC family transcriptional regulator [Myxococcota bacterium]
MPVIGELVRRLQGRLDEDWSLEKLADEAGYEVHHLAHLFRDRVGVAPLRYVRLLRLERAAHWLESEHGLDEIAARSGYASTSAFTRAFRREFGVPPGAFRRAGGGRGTRVTADGTAPTLPEGVASWSLVELEALALWTTPIADFGPLEVLRGWGALLGDGRPPGAWELGAWSAPFGWFPGSQLQDLRSIRVAGPGRPPPGVIPWRVAAQSWLRCEYASGARGVEDRAAALRSEAEEQASRPQTTERSVNRSDDAEQVIGWMIRELVPSLGLRLGFAHSFSLVESPFNQPLALRLYVPVEGIAGAVKGPAGAEQ